MSEGRGARLARTLRNLFDDLSFAQVGAGALAAVTSMLLSSQIGIAGSVIGAAVGSVVSAVSSQVYKKMLAASADKLKDSIPVPSDVLQGSPSAPSGNADPAGPDAPDGAFGNRPEVLEAAGRRETEALPSTLTSAADVSADAVLLRAHVAREKRKKRRVIAVAVISSLLAVAASGAIVYGLTEGEGLGTKPEPVLTSVRPQVESSGSAAASSESAVAEGSSDGDSADKGRQDLTSDGAGESEKGSASTADQGTQDDGERDAAAGPDGAAAGGASNAGGGATDAGSNAGGTAGSASGANAGASGVVAPHASAASSLALAS